MATSDNWWCARYALPGNDFMYAHAHSAGSLLSHELCCRYTIPSGALYHDWWPQVFYPTKRDLPRHRTEIEIFPRRG